MSVSPISLKCITMTPIVLLVQNRLYSDAIIKYNMETFTAARIRFSRKNTTFPDLSVDNSVRFVLHRVALQISYIFLFCLNDFVTVFYAAIFVYAI